tara:strand:- start:79 stop:249 length:171 start_codon:yes stop_codon:yes gene_type:complete
MDILTLHLIAVGCIVYLSYRYGVYAANKEFDKYLRDMEEIEKRLKQRKPDPFFTRR